MSLLLKALRQAEAANADKPAGGRDSEPDFELEPLSSPSAAAREWVEPPSLLFGSSGLTPQPSRRAPFRWPQLSLVPLAALVAAGYGVYLYFALQPPAAMPLPPPAATTGPITAPQPAMAPGPDTATGIVAAPPAATAAEPAPPLPAPVAAAADVAGMAATAPPASPVETRSPRPVPAAQAPPAEAPAATAPAFRPDAESTLLARAYDAYQRGALAEATQRYAQAAANRRSADALLGLAAIASVQGREDDAQRLYREVLERDPRNATAQGALLDLLGNTDGAATESRLKMLIERDPGPHLYQTLGNLYAGQQRWHDAQAAYFEAVRGAPGNADYAFNLAVSLDQLRQYPAALTYYEQALAAGGAHRFDRGVAETRVRQLRSIR